MAAKGQSKSAKIARWKLLEVRLRAQLTEQPHLTAAHTELQGLITEAEALESQLELHRAAFRETSSKLTKVAKAGDALRFRLSGAIQFTLGPENNLLLEYGLKPRRPAGGRPAKAKRPTPAPAVTPEAPPASRPEGG